LAKHKKEISDGLWQLSLRPDRYVDYYVLAIYVQSNLFLESVCS